ncbi:MAG: sugar nucleotide-binding protein [Acidobacteria bacterium]|nr:sugar nucleotide-binding protein [Acidobacteriota bacterium]
MKPTTVAVLGAGGMLGSMIVDELSRDGRLEVIAAARDELWTHEGPKRVPGARWCSIEIGDRHPTMAALRALGPVDWFVNATGIIKQRIRDDRPSDVEAAVLVNALFPHWLAAAGRELGAKVLQIATDCVYSGGRGEYVETDTHDAVDVYGWTKSLGEVPGPGFYSLRCSIVGPEPRRSVSLLEWFRRQPAHAAVSGYANHRWNGVTTLHFARICGSVIRGNLALPNLQHVVPSGEITKNDLLRCFADSFHRRDVTITPVDTPNPINRTLSTLNLDCNHLIWSDAGYPGGPPTIRQMIAELAAFDYRLKDTRT